jgi:hypothetical protein
MATDVKQNNNGWWWTSDATMTKVQWQQTLDETARRNDVAKWRNKTNCDGMIEQNSLLQQLHQQRRYRTICVYELYDNGVQKKKKKIPSISCFYLFIYFLLFLLPKVLHGLFTTWQQAQKHTRVHSPDANLKTCAQGKQVYVGLHHLVQILYYNQLVCVCVCACVLPRPKAGSKTNFGAAHSFFPLKLRNLKLHNL